MQSAVDAPCLLIPPAWSPPLLRSWTFWSAWILAFAMIIAISCVPQVRRHYPTNVIVLCVFTCVEAWLIGTITARYVHACIPARLDLRAVGSLSHRTQMHAAICCLHRPLLHCRTLSNNPPPPVHKRVCAGTRLRRCC